MLLSLRRGWRSGDRYDDGRHAASPPSTVRQPPLTLLRLAVWSCPAAARFALAIVASALLFPSLYAHESPKIAFQPWGAPCGWDWLPSSGTGAPRWRRAVAAGAARWSQPLRRVRSERFSSLMPPVLYAGRVKSDGRGHVSCWGWQICFAPRCPTICTATAHFCV
jgi:hypothetical protein